MNIDKILEKMTIEEKVAICSGKDFWNTKGFPSLGINSIMLTDGPHGLRKQAASADHLGINESVPATCFPPACATGNSFNTELIRQMGEAVGEECLAEEVSVVLGPGLNIKRSPLCGRNFEYYSEDPIISGEMAAAFVSGVQSKNVGACLKHFAANNQEKARMVNDSVIDERALREIYLKGFEIAVKKSNPWSIMGSYNKINSTYVCEDKRLLSDILRKEWGFDGVAMTDWGATNDRVAGLKAGLDLEMPSSNGANDKDIINALKSGTLTIASLNESVKRILTMIQRTKNPKKPCDLTKHHLLAKSIATECAVLLKNDDSVLPLNAKSDLCIIGRFAKELRFQGGGSSKINPYRVDNVCDALDADSIKYSYFDGYDDPETTNEELIGKAVEGAKNCAQTVIIAGLPDSYESEGFDRTHIELPPSHNALIDAVATANPNTIVILINGSVVNMPWASKVKSILTMALPGQAGGSAIVDLLFAKAIPSGRLSETYIRDIKSNSSYLNFAEPNITKYKESVYVGYRYYNTAKIPVAFPFGHGLSYSQFEYSNLKLSSNKLAGNDELIINVDITNTGNYDAKEVVQIYVKAPSLDIFRPERELKAFKKVYIKKGETQKVSLTLNKDSFAYYNVVKKTWDTENGEHTIIVGKNATEDILTQNVLLNYSKDITKHLFPAEYSNLATPTPLNISDESFTKLLGKALPTYTAPTKKTYTLSATLGEIKHTTFGKNLYEQTLNGMKAQIGNAFGDDLGNLENMLTDMPLRAMILFSGGALSKTMLEGFIDVLNGKKLRGFIKIIKGSTKKK